MKKSLLKYSPHLSYRKQSKLLLTMLSTIMIIHDAGSLRLHGHAQIAQSTFSIRALVNAAPTQEGTTIGDAVNLLKDKQPLSNSDNPILEGPGVVTVNISDKFQIETYGNSLTPPTSISGSQILVLTKTHSSKPAQMNTDGYSGLLVSTEAGELSATAIKFRIARNTSLRQTDLTNLTITNAATNLLPSGGSQTILATTEGTVHTMLANGQMNIALDSSQNGALFSNNAQFQPLIEADNNKKFYFMSANTTPTDAPMNKVAVATLGAGASSINEHDSLEYLAVVLGGGIDFNLNDLSIISTEISLEAPIEAITHESFYHSISPEISVMFDLGLKIGNRSNTLGLHRGKKYTRYASKVLAFTGSGATATLSESRKNNQYMSHSYTSVTANIEITPMVQGHIEYQISDRDENVDLFGITTGATVAEHRISAGVAATFQF